MNIEKYQKYFSEEEKENMTNRMKYGFMLYQKELELDYIEKAIISEFGKNYPTIAEAVREKLFAEIAEI